MLRPLVEEAGRVAVLVALEVGHEAADVDQRLLQQARAHGQLVGKVLLQPVGLIFDIMMLVTLGNNWSHL